MGTDSSAVEETSTTLAPKTRMLESDNSCPSKFEGLLQTLGEENREQSIRDACRVFDEVLAVKDKCDDAFVEAQKLKCSTCKEGDTSDTCIFVYLMDYSCDSLTCESIVGGFQQLKSGCCGSSRSLQAIDSTQRTTVASTSAAKSDTPSTGTTTSAASSESEASSESSTDSAAPVYV